MARTCTKCGASVSDRARFCGKCGEVLQAANNVSGTAEKIPAWSGWDVPKTPAAASQAASGQQTAAVRFSKPAPAQPAAPASAPAASPAPAAAPVPPPAQAAPAAAPPTSAMPSNAPQFWDSYDYESGAAPGGSTVYPSGSSEKPPYYDVRRDASRPLPKLDDVMGSYKRPSYDDTPDSYDDIDDDIEARRAKAYDTVTTFSLWCAGLVLFPMPFVDLVFLVPVQSAMVISISKIYGVKESPEKIMAILAGACGASVFGQFTTLFLANWLPIIGKLLSAPFVFGWSYGLGEVAIRYFESKGTASKDELKKIFKKASKEASSHYDSSKVNPQEALENIRNYVSEDEYRKIRERFGPRNS